MFTVYGNSGTVLEMLTQYWTMIKSITEFTSDFDIINRKQTEGRTDIFVKMGITVSAHASVGRPVHVPGVRSVCPLPAARCPLHWTNPNTSQAGPYRNHPSERGNKRLTITKRHRDHDPSLGSIGNNSDPDGTSVSV